MKRFLALAAAALLATAAHAQTIRSEWVLYEIGAPTTPLGRDTTQALCDARAKAINKSGVFRCDRESTVVGSAPSITLAGLPASSTAERTASISYTVKPAATQVWCRRDGFAPIICPNPFTLGTGAPLDPGPHTVDFYLNTVDVLKPVKSHSWTITAPPVVTPPVVPPVTGVAKLTKFPILAWEANTTSSTMASDLTLPALGADGAVAFNTNVADPAGGAQRVNFHRVRPGYAVRVGGHRSEHQMVGGVMAQDRSYWIAFAVYVPASWGTSGPSGDRQTFWQVHAQNDLSPPVSLLFNGETNRLYWYHFDAAQRDEIIHTEPAAMPRDQWIKYVVHYQKSFAGSPAFEVWRGFGSGNVSYTKILDRKVPFGFDLPGKPDWIKQGIYKWTMGAYGSSTDRTIYTYGEFLQEGANLYDNAVASLADL